MQITKLGHCALVLKDKNIMILTDPGSFTVEAQSAQKGIDCVLITHEHADHFHIESLKAVLKNNPGAVIVCNKAVAALVTKEGIGTTMQVVGDGESTQINNVSIEGYGTEHALVYPPDIGLVENTGYFVANKFYFPGDNFHNPGKPVDILALPVAGPWMKISEAIDFAKAVKPRVAFPVHDGMMRPEFNFNAMMAGHLIGASFVTLREGETKEF